MCNTSATEIHLIFDRYFFPPIKYSERKKWKKSSISYEISGPSQTRPTDFMKSLQNIKFKEALVTFLAKQFQNNDMIPTVGTKKIYLTSDERCYSNRVFQWYKKNEEIP